MKKELLKHLMMAVLFTIFSVSMTSCGDDDPTPDSVKKALEGDWRIEHATATTMGYTVNMSRNELLSYAQQMGVKIWDETLHFSGNKVNGAKYVVDGDTFYFEDYKEFVSTFEMSDELLKFTYDMSGLVGMQCTVVLYYERI